MALHHESKTMRMARIARKVARTGLTGAFGVVALAFALITFPRAFGYHSSVVYGASMGAAAPRGGVVLTGPVAATDVAVDDVILMRTVEAGRRSTPVLHRVIEIGHDDGGRFARTKGDANADPDPRQFRLSGPVHRMVIELPWIGYVVAFLQTPVGWMIGCVASSTVLAAIMLTRIWAPAPTTRRLVTPGVLPAP